MIEQQIRTWGVLDSNILAALKHVGRETFVPPDYRHLAFADVEIPIGQAQTMMEPKLEARLLQALAPKPGENILEVGTGSGYMTALLSHAGANVTTVEIYPELISSAAEALAAAGISNLSMEQGDASAGWGPEASWDAILHLHRKPGDRWSAGRCHWLGSGHGGRARRPRRKWCTFAGITF